MPLALSKLMLEFKSSKLKLDDPRLDLLCGCRNDGTVARSSTEFLPTEGGTDHFRSKS